MRIYHKDGVVIAWHDDAQTVPAEVYGEGVEVGLWPDGTPIGRLGEAPAEGEPDRRPLALPAVDDAVRGWRRARTKARFGALMRALAAAGHVTAEEAIAWGAQRAVPAKIAAVFEALPPPDRDAARILWATADEVERTHPIVAAIAGAVTPKLTAAQLDALFVAADLS